LTGVKVDICAAQRHVRFAPNNDRESGHRKSAMSALPLKADVCGANSYVCFAPIADMIHRLVRYFLYVPEASLYREYSESGVSPAFKITDVASGDVRKRISALAASGCRTVLVSIPTKKVVG